MTVNQDAQKLIDEAVAAGHRTTVGYVNKHWKVPPAGTQWATHEEKLKQARALLDPPVVVPPPPTSGVPFGSRPRIQAPNRFQGGSDIVVSGKSIAGLGNYGETLSFEGCRNVTIIDCDLVSPGCRIMLLSCTGVLTVSNVRAKDVGWNLIQLDKCVMSGSISRCQVLGGKPEDVISIDASGGPDAQHPLVIEDNRIEGVDWVSMSGSGIMTDNNPGHVIVRRNSLLNPGQVGIGVHGPSVHVIGNTLYSDGRLIPGREIIRVGIDCADARAAGCEVSGNQVDWRNSGGGYESYSTLSSPKPVGWASNDFEKRFSAAELAAMRPAFP